MYRLMLAALMIFCCALVTAAQSEPRPRAEIFAGYSLLRTDYEAEQPDPPMPVIVAFSGKQTLNGFNASVTLYLTEGFGLTGDFSGHFKTNSVQDPLGGNIETKIRIFNVLGGPQYKFRNNSRVGCVAKIGGDKEGRKKFHDYAAIPNKLSTNFA